MVNSSVETDLIKIYQTKRNKLQIEDHYPLIKFDEKDDGQCKAILNVESNYCIESQYWSDKQGAKLDCYERALKYFKKKEESIEKRKRNQSYKTLLLYLILTSIMVMHIMYVQNLLLLVLNPLIVLFFVSPFFLREYEIGTCNGARVKVCWTSSIENIFHERVYHLDQGDFFLIKKKAIPNSNPNYFEAIILKQVVLNSNKANRAFPTFVLPTNMRCGISINDTNQEQKYYIDLISYGEDNRAKRYTNLNVPADSFKRINEESKYHIFSKFGEQVIYERYISRSGTDGINWYISVLSLFLSMIFTKINDILFKQYQIQHGQIGFDHFQVAVPNLVYQ